MIERWRCRCQACEDYLDRHGVPHWPGSHALPLGVNPAPDQPLPTVDPRSRSVTAELRILLDAREQRGIATYGDTLRTHNGRSAPRDLVEELIDGAQYALQWEMERADLLEEIARLKGELESKSRVLESVKADANTAMLRHQMEASAWRDS